MGGGPVRPGNGHAPEGYVPVSDRTDTNRQNMARARETFAASFESAEAKSEHYRELAARSAKTRADRVYLTRDEASALVECYSLLRGIARRSKIRDLVADAPDNDNAPAETGAEGGQ